MSAAGPLKLVGECGSFGVSLKAWCMRWRIAYPRGDKKLEPCVTYVQR